RPRSAASRGHHRPWRRDATKRLRGNVQGRGYASLRMRKVRGPVAACVVLACFLFGMAACSLPRLQDYEARPLAQTSFLYAADGSLITPLHATEDRVALTSAQMTQNIRDAVVAIEDRRFYDHHGVDPEAIVRAAVNDLRSGRIVEGGSTITQQLVKNL